MGEEDDHISHGCDDCLEARTEQESRDIDGTSFHESWPRLGWRDLLDQIIAIKKSMQALREKNLRQYDGPVVHKATVPPGFRQAAAEDQNRGISNQ